MRKKTWPTPTQNGKPRRPNTEQLGRSKLTCRNLFWRDLRRKSQKSFFQYLYRYLLTFAWKNKIIMVLVVSCCGLRTELRTPFNPEKSCTNSRTVFEADICNKYVCSKFEFSKIFLENSQKTRRSWSILHQYAHCRWIRCNSRQKICRQRSRAAVFFFFSDGFFLFVAELAIIHGKWRSSLGTFTQGYTPNMK